MAAALNPVMATLNPVMNRLAQVLNSSATFADHTLVGIAIADAQGVFAVPTPVVDEVVTPFPATIQCLQTMTDRQIRAFLVAYGLPLGVGNTRAAEVRRKNSLARFIGVRANVAVK
mmetsp:Transcript_15050/g.20669  ORF Transcript_15050/g.20669 Transcript_15050/m.20669 type:complete len:116 (-) Transcript_15050:153-500(-)